MHIRFTFFLIGLFISKPCLSQEHCIAIRDIESSEPVPYAIITWSINHGVISDPEGVFCIKNVNSVNISAIGYRKEEFKIDHQKIIWLRREPISLNAVTIKAPKRGKSDKMIRTGEGKVITNTLTLNSSLPIAQYFQGIEQEATLGSLRVELSPNNSTEILSYRLKISVLSNDAGLPGRDLLQTINTVEVKPTDKFFEIDLSQYNLKMKPKGIWIAIQTLGFTEPNGPFKILKPHEFGPWARHKKRIKVLQHYSPSFVFVKSGYHQVAESLWNGAWRFLELNPKNKYKMSFKMDLGLWLD